MGGVYFVFQDQKLSVQGVEDLHIFYINNCVIIPRVIDEKYKIADYFLRFFQIKSLVNIDDNVFDAIRQVKICIIHM